MLFGFAPCIMYCSTSVILKFFGKRAQYIQKWHNTNGKGITHTERSFYKQKGHITYRKRA